MPFYSNLIHGIRERLNRPLRSTTPDVQSASSSGPGSGSDVGASTGSSATGRLVAAAFSRHSRNPCPICLGDVEFPVLTNCGHCFCATCIVGYWKVRTFPSAVECPICRSGVTLLLTDGTLRDTSGMDDVRRDISAYNHRFSGEPRALLDYLRDIPVLIPHLCSRFFSWNGLVVMFRFRIIVCVLAALIYALSPFDLVPEAFFGILGFLDDAFVFFLLLIYLSILYRRFVSNSDV